MLYAIRVMIEGIGRNGLPFEAIELERDLSVCQGTGVNVQNPERHPLGQGLLDWSCRVTLSPSLITAC